MFKGDIILPWINSNKLFLLPTRIQWIINVNIECT